MNCEKLRYQIPDYVSNRLSEEEKRVVEQHIETCTDCKDEVLNFQNLFSLINSSKSWMPPDNYFVNLLPRIHNSIENKVSWKPPEWIVRFVLPIASLTMLIFFLVRFAPTMFNNRSDDMQVVLRELQPEDLQYIYEKQDAGGVLEFSAVTEQSNISRTDEKENIKELLQNESDIFKYSSFDPQSAIESMDDSEIDQLVTMMEKRSFMFN